MQVWRATPTQGTWAYKLSTGGVQWYTGHTEIVSMLLAKEGIDIGFYGINYSGTVCRTKSLSFKKKIIYQYIYYLE